MRGGHHNAILSGKCNCNTYFYLLHIKCKSVSNDDFTKNVLPLRPTPVQFMGTTRYPITHIYWYIHEYE